jgi:hypothetical protein
MKIVFNDLEEYGYVSHRQLVVKNVSVMPFDKSVILELQEKDYKND